MHKIIEKSGNKNLVFIPRNAHEDTLAKCHEVADPEIATCPTSTTLDVIQRHSDDEENIILPSTVPRPISNNFNPDKLDSSMQINQSTVDYSPEDNNFLYPRLLQQAHL